MSQQPQQKPSARRLERAGAAVLAILGVMVIAFLVGRMIWHEDVQDADPASVTAPDANGGNGTPGAAPATTQ